MRWLEQPLRGRYQSVMLSPSLEPQTTRDGRVIYPANDDRYSGLGDQRMQREVVVLD